MGGELVRGSLGSRGMEAWGERNRVRVSFPQVQRAENHRPSFPIFFVSLLVGVWDAMAHVQMSTAVPSLYLSWYGSGRASARWFEPTLDFPEESRCGFWAFLAIEHFPNLCVLALLKHREPQQWRTSPDVGRKLLPNTMEASMRKIS